jgi:beta-glucosidase
MVLPAAAGKNAALRFDTIVSRAPAGKVTMAMGSGTVDATALFTRLAGKGKQVVHIPLSCFQARGTDLAKVEAPFSVTSDAAFAAAFANIEIAGGAASEVGAVKCEELK